MLSRMYTTMSNNGLVLGKLIQVPPSPPGFFFRLFFLDHVSMMGLGGGSTDDTWINFPTSVDIYIIYIYIRIYKYVPGSKLPLFPYSRGWSSTQ